MALDAVFEKYRRDIFVECYGCFRLRHAIGITRRDYEEGACQGAQLSENGEESLFHDRNLVW
jgi:hypothetical protein